jgi:hypothetical protein
MGINSKLIVDSRLVANTLSLLHNGTGDFNDEVVNSEVREFKRRQMAERVMRNTHNDNLRFNNTVEFRIAYLDFKQKQISNNEDDMTAM